jgi:hypothetical protein
LHFSGQIGTIHFFNGVWDKDTVRKVYTHGSFWDPSTFETGTEFLTIRPEAYLINEERQDHNTPIPTLPSLSFSPPSIRCESPNTVISPLTQNMDTESSVQELTPLMGYWVPVITTDIECVIAASTSVEILTHKLTM